MRDGFSVILHFRTDDEQAKNLRELAENTDRPVGWLVRQAVAEYLERHYVQQITGSDHTNIEDSK